MRRHPFDKSKQRLTRAQAKTAGVLGLAGAIALPIVLWHHALAMLAAASRPTLVYFLTGWAPFALIALGLAMFVPVVYSIGLSSYARRYPRHRNVYAGWGMTLYLLGLALATQVAAISHGLAPH
jgi:hypothetical protein